MVIGQIALDDQKILPLCRKYDIVFLGMFGSYARGTDVTEKSDLDLIVRFSKRKSLFDLVGIEQELSDELGVKVDLLTEGAISPYLKDRIMKEMKVLYDETK
jgi:hypothetical protein